MSGADDAMRALRASMSQSEPDHAGSHYRFSNLVVDPCAVQPRVPLWVGGRSLRSLRRAVTLGDGWCPFGISNAQASEWLSRVDVPEDFAVVLGPARPFDPIADPELTSQAVADLAGAGATIVSVRFVHHSLNHYLEQLEAMTQVMAVT